MAEHVAGDSPPTPATGFRHERTFLGHPRGLFVLFFTEMWERFSFYSMRAFLVLYMTVAIQFSDQQANEIYGAYLGFVYSAPFVGGMLADRLLGQRLAIVIGGLLMAAAQFVLAGHSLLLDSGGSALGLQVLFFAGLGMLSAGNGFFKPNISTIVGSLYEQNDPRRDGAFTIFYMGINLGAWLAGFSGEIAEKVDWHWGFLLAGTGMLVGQLIFFLGRGSLHGRGLPPDPKAFRARWHFGLPRLPALAIGVVLFIVIASFFLAKPTYVQSLAVIVAVPVLGYLLWEVKRSPRVEGQRMLVIIILCVFSMMFWAFFELAGSAILLFTDRNVDRTMFGWEPSASMLTAQINPLFIMLMGIPFAKLWVWLDRRRMEPSSPLKFALGLLQLGLGFFVMYLGAVQAGETGRCNVSYLILGFYLHTTGELCLSPVGLSTITKLSPPRLVGTFMGVWFLASALGNVFGGKVGGLTEAYGFGTVFFWIGATAVAAAVVLLVLVPILKRMMHGVK